jgi:hypothetical protein
MEAIEALVLTNKDFKLARSSSTKIDDIECLHFCRPLVDIHLANIIVYFSEKEEAIKILKNRWSGTGVVRNSENPFFYDFLLRNYVLRYTSQLSS